MTDLDAKALDEKALSAAMSAAYRLSVGNPVDMISDAIRAYLSAINYDATERARLEGEVARLREALEKVAAEFDAIGTLHAAMKTEDANRISTVVKLVREALRHDR